MLAEDRRLTLILIAEELCISKDMEHTIFHDDLGKWKICCTSSHTSGKQNVSKLLETLFPCVTRINYFLKISPREMRPSATSSIWNQNGNQWRGVHRLPQDQKRVVCKNLRSKHYWSSSLTAKASSIRNLFLQIKSLSHFTRQFWTDCYSVSGGFDWTCTELENGRCTTIMPLHTICVYPFLAQKMVAVLDYLPYSPDQNPAVFFLFYLLFVFYIKLCSIKITYKTICLSQWRWLVLAYICYYQAIPEL